ncbi:signal transduction histidine kinase [Paenibacillus phyllosphaerae]|uniref:histidine kinase n=1 Tax=Paenibacillus phyllosphaerae TaxID=274593 RepID=A0A7W5AYD8_9BACL|nr:sensor histidine kinase [Paenibacillus phyllosphaerae]MBB3111049.1 signal transduction histidine kinase [Paenibacillus phyllosphaerae]
MKGWSRFRSMRTQLIISFMVISLVVLSAGSYYIYSFMLGTVKDQNERLLFQQFQQIDHNIQGLIADVDRLEKLFLNDEQVQQLLLNLTDKSQLEFLSYQNTLHSRIKLFIDNYNYVHSIYITAENHGAIGGSGDTTLVQPVEEWKKSFFDSELYERTVAAYPEYIVAGRMKKSFFNPYMSGEKDGAVISVMRGTRAIYDPRISATLIFNIDERYLASIYATSLDANDGEMYIADGDGIILSGSSTARIGSPSLYMPDPADGQTYGSRDMNKGNERVQVVYYKLQGTDWYVMKEIPLDVYSAQIYKVQRTIAVVFLLSLLVIFIISAFWLNKMVRPLHLLAGKMKDMSRGELGVTFDQVPNNEFGTVIRRFNEMSLSIVDLLEKNNKMQEQKRELEIESLQYQINPHFLYNTLNMVRWMASMMKADNIVDTIVALGNILRPVFSSKDPMCSLRDEISYLQHYMTITNMRFNNSIQFDIDVDEPSWDCRVPRFILQPLVENSIASGRQVEDHAIFIGIRAQVKGEQLVIQVTDSGAGLDPEQLEELNRKLQSGEGTESSSGGSGIGLANVNKRIQLYFGPDYGLHFVPRAKGAEVVVRLPSIHSS